MKTVHTTTSDFPILHLPAQIQTGEEAYFNYTVDKQKVLSIKQGKHIFIDENGYVFNHYEIFPFSFTNMMWMPLGSQVIEIRMKESYDQWCYYEMAATFDHRYAYLLCDAHQVETNPHDGDVIINLENLESQLQEATQILR